MHRSCTIKGTGCSWVYAWNGVPMHRSCMVKWARDLAFDHVVHLTIGRSWVYAWEIKNFTPSTYTLMVSMKDLSPGICMRLGAWHYKPSLSSLDKCLETLSDQIDQMRTYFIFLGQMFRNSKWTTWSNANLLLCMIFYVLLGRKLTYTY
jgi:hypothetical protein